MLRSLARRLKGICFGAALVGFGWAAPASADLIFLGEVDLQGTGLGNVETIITLQETQNPKQDPTDTELGMNGFLGGMYFEGGDIIDSQTSSQSFADLMVTSAADFRLFLNAAEPQNSQDISFTITGFTVSFYRADGTGPIFQATLFPLPQVFTDGAGVGNSALMFGLDATQAAQAQAIFSDPVNAPFAGIQVGVSLMISGAQGGVETLFGGSAGLGTPIPEPGSLALLGVGLLGLGVVMRRRKAAPKGEPALLTLVAA